MAIQLPLRNPPRCDREDPDKRTRNLREEPATTTAPPGSADSGRDPNANGSLRPTPARPCQRRDGASGPYQQHTTACRRMSEELSLVQLRLTGTGTSGRAGHLSCPLVWRLRCGSLQLRAGHRSTPHGHRDRLCPKRGEPKTAMASSATVKVRSSSGQREVVHVDLATERVAPDIG